MNIIDHNGVRIKLNESKKPQKYLDFARELKTLWNIKVTVVLLFTEVLLKNPERSVNVNNRVVFNQTFKGES